MKNVKEKFAYIKENLWTGNNKQKEIIISDDTFNENITYISNNFFITVISNIILDYLRYKSIIICELIEEKIEMCGTLSSYIKSKPHIIVDNNIIELAKITQKKIEIKWINSTNNFYGKFMLCTCCWKNPRYNQYIPIANGSELFHCCYMLNPLTIEIASIDTQQNLNNKNILQINHDSLKYILEIPEYSNLFFNKKRGKGCSFIKYCFLDDLMKNFYFKDKEKYFSEHNKKINENLKSISSSINSKLTLINFCELAKIDEEENNKDKIIVWQFRNEYSKNIFLELIWSISLFYDYYLSKRFCS